MVCKKKYNKDYDKEYYGGKKLAKKMNKSIEGMAIGEKCPAVKKRGCKK